MHLLTVDSNGNITTINITTPQTTPFLIAPAETLFICVDDSGNLSTTTPVAIYQNSNLSLLTVDPSTNEFSVTKSAVFNPCATVNGEVHGSPNSDGTCACNTGWSGTSGRCNTCDDGFLSPNCSTCKTGYGWKNSDHKKCVANQNCIWTCASDGTVSITTPSAGDGTSCPAAGSACAYGSTDIKDSGGNRYSIKGWPSSNPRAYGGKYYDYYWYPDGPTITKYECNTSPCLYQRNSVRSQSYSNYIFDDYTQNIYQLDFNA